MRTLVIAYKKMNRTEYEKLIQKVENARQVIGIEREMYTEKAYNQLENGLTLLGVTAVEDRLQEEVQETLECLRVAGIKVSLSEIIIIKLQHSCAPDLIRPPITSISRVDMGVDRGQSRNRGEYSFPVRAVQRWYRSVEDAGRNDGGNVRRTYRVLRVSVIYYPSAVLSVILPMQDTMEIHFCLF